MPTSPRLHWPFPSQGQEPWFDTFESMVGAMDASGFAAREDRHTIFMEGGTFSFAANTGVLTWTQPIEILSGVTGFRWLIPAASLVLQEGDMFWVDLPRGPTANISTTAQKSNQIPSSDTAQIIGIRRNNRVYFRFGYILLDGQSVPLFSSPPTGSGAIQTENVVPSPKDVTGNLNTYIGSVYLLSGNILFARAMLGSQLIADTATVTILRNLDATLLLTIAGTGFLAPRTVMNVPVSEGWYDCYLASDNAVGTSICGGLYFEVV